MWLSLLKSPKLWAVIAVVAALATAYNIGKSVAEGEAAQQRADALEQQRERLHKRYAENVATLQSDHTAALARARANTTTETEIREVIKYVDREIKVPGECTQLASDVVRVQHEASRIIREAARSADTQ
jgi:hypothetical protein